MASLINWKFIRFLIVWAVLFPATAGGGQKFLSDLDILPPGVEIRKYFKPGRGVEIGSIDQVSGRVVVVHTAEIIGYEVTEGTPLFENDIIATLSGAHAGLLFNDGSTVLIAPLTRLQITRSVYSPKDGLREALINMAVGKARFVVKKLIDIRYSQFNVNTRETALGVRGSDFIVVTLPGFTEISSLKDTVLVVRSLDVPEKAPVLLRGFEYTMVKRGKPATAPRHLEAQEVDRRLRYFLFQPRFHSEEEGEIKPTVDYKNESKSTSPPIEAEKELPSPTDINLHQPIQQPTPVTSAPSMEGHYSFESIEKNP